MLETWPNLLKLEVKISRTHTFHLSDRDLKGIAPDGYVAGLISERLLHGPRWVLVPAGQLQARAYEDSELCLLAEGVQTDLSNELNLLWSNWILDESVWERLLQQDHMKIKPAIEWCLKCHPPRDNKSSGNLREGRIAEALKQFRAKFDEFQIGENSPQQEGFIHQYLLSHALERLGYNSTVNPVGVPDISALWVGNAAAGRTEREKLMLWQPDEQDLKELREYLLRQSDDTLHNLRRILS